jgi:16S rRNA processing protein RimM
MGADERELLEVGRIMKAHGLKGQVSVELWSDRLERVAPGSVLVTDRGPLTVVASIAHQQRFLVTFREIADRNDAERWRGVTLRAGALDVDDVLWIHEMFGARVETTDGTVRGQVVAVEQNPASDLLVLDSGALVPLTFVVSVQPHEMIVVDTPEGLFE